MAPMANHSSQTWPGSTRTLPAPALPARVRPKPADMFAIRARYDAKRDHLCLVRDEEIERLNREIGSWEKKYRTLEDAMHRMWPEEGTGK